MFKYTYLDEDGDEITVTNNDDFQEALEYMGDKLKLAVDINVERSQYISNIAA